MKMNKQPAQSLEPKDNAILITLLIIASIWMLFGAGVTIAKTSFFPYAFGVHEGEIMNSTQLLLQGKPLYGPISVENVPTAYFPLFFVTLAAWLKMTVNTIVSARIFQLVLYFATAGLLYRYVSRQSGRTIYGLLAAVLWLGIYAQYDTPIFCFMLQVDNLLTLLVLAGTIYLSLGHGVKHLMGSAICFTAAALTKQNMLPLALVPVGLAFLVLPARQRFWVCLPLVIGVIGAMLLNQLSDGWFFTWTVSVAHHPFRLEEWAQVLTREVLGRTAPLIFLTLLWAIVEWPRIWKTPEASAPFLVLGFLAVIGYVGSLKLGGGPNHLYPYYAVMFAL